MQERHTTSVSSLHRFVGGITYFGSSIAMSLRASVLLTAWPRRPGTLESVLQHERDDVGLGGVRQRARAARRHRDLDAVEEVTDRGAVPVAEELRTGEPRGEAVTGEPGAVARAAILLYASSPRVACASVKTPLLTVFSTGRPPARP